MRMLGQLNQRAATTAFCKGVHRLTTRMKPTTVTRARSA
jgi:hypothetical protein